MKTYTASASRIASIVIGGSVGGSAGDNFRSVEIGGSTVFTGIPAGIDPVKTLAIITNDVTVREVM